jgi:hypothetical protein
LSTEKLQLTLIDMGFKEEFYKSSVGSQSSEGSSDDCLSSDLSSSLSMIEQEVYIDFEFPLD